MSFFKKRKSLALVSSVVLAMLFIIVIAVMSSYSYISQKKSYQRDMEGTARTLGVVTNSRTALINTAKERLAAGTVEGAPEFTEIEIYLMSMDTNATIKNTYLMLPDKVEKDGKTSLTMLQGSFGITQAGYTPGHPYELSAEYLRGYEDVQKNGFAQLKPYKDDMGTWLTYLVAIKDSSNNTVGLFGIDFDYGLVEKDLNRLLWTSIFIGLLCTAVAIGLVVLLIRLVTRPIKHLSEVAALAAKGDLTVTLPVTNDNEIGRASTAFNEMILGLRQLAGQIRTTSSEVAASSVTMQDSAEQTSRATEEVSEAIQDVAEGADTQLQSFQECQRAMNEMTIGIQRIAESSSNVSELALDASELATAGDAVINRTVSQMQMIESNVTETSAVMQELEQMNSQIGAILDMIGDVANQTNLLALNASIEAARAGEHGKGFAVVAHEIRKLAERSKESSEQISTILGGIKGRTDEAAASLEKAAEGAREGSAVSRQAGESFRLIMEAIRQVSTQVQEVSAASEQMSAGSEQIAASLDQLEHIAESSSSQAQRVAAASEEQLASMQEIASSSAQLRNLATGLNQAVGTFKTE
jgi:Methyl-accepting chemotaxis protein